MHSTALRVAVLAVVGLALAACGGTASTSPPSTSQPHSPTAAPGTGPAAVVSAAELRRWEGDALAFAQRFNDSWADAETAFAPFTEDAAVIDSSNADFSIAPKSEMIAAWRGFATDVPDYNARTTGAYLSTAAGAYLTEVKGLWPADVTSPSGQPLLHELRLFRFAGELSTAAATTLELWYRLDEAEVLHGGCVAPDRCASDVRAFADRYLAAWSSGDPEQIAALYRDDATLADSLLEVKVSGADAIGGVGPARFGSGAPACSVQDVYIQNNDGDPKTSDNTDPDGGKIIGLAIVHRCTPAAGSSQAIDGVSVVLLGTRQPKGFDLDPRGLIVSDETFHDADSLVASGIAQ